MIGKNKFAASVAVCILLTLAMSACDRKNINDILANPSQYSKREVVVAGNVVRSVSILGNGAYEIDDGTGKLWVVSQTGVPREGAKVMVKGTILDAFNLGSAVKLPELVSSGLVMREISHKAQN